MKFNKTKKALFSFLGLSLSAVLATALVVSCSSQPQNPVKTPTKTTTSSSPKKEETSSSQKSTKNSDNSNSSSSKKTNTQNSSKNSSKQPTVSPKTTKKTITSIPKLSTNAYLLPSPQINLNLSSYYVGQTVQFSLPSTLFADWNVDGVQYNNQVLISNSSGVYQFSVVNNVNQIAISLTSKLHANNQQLVLVPFQILSRPSINTVKIVWPNTVYSGQTVNFILPPSLFVHWTVLGLSYNTHNLTLSTKNEYTIQASGNNQNTYVAFKLRSKIDSNATYDYVLSNPLFVRALPTASNIHFSWKTIPQVGQSNQLTLLLPEDWNLKTNQVEYDSSTITVNNNVLTIIPTIPSSSSFLSFDLVNSNLPGVVVSVKVPTINLNILPANWWNNYLNNSNGLSFQPTLPWPSKLYVGAHVKLLIPPSITSVWELEGLYQHYSSCSNSGDYYSFVVQQNNDFSLSLQSKSSNSQFISFNLNNLPPILAAPKLVLNSQVAYYNQSTFFSLPTSLLSEWNVLQVSYNHQNCALVDNNLYEINIPNTNAPNSIQVLLALKSDENETIQLTSNNFLQLQQKPSVVNNIALNFLKTNTNSEQLAFTLANDATFNNEYVVKQVFYANQLLVPNAQGVYYFTPIRGYYYIQFKLSSKFNSSWIFNGISQSFSYQFSTVPVTNSFNTSFAPVKTLNATTFLLANGASLNFGKTQGSNSEVNFNLQLNAQTINQQVFYTLKTNYFFSSLNLFANDIVGFGLYAPNHVYVPFQTYNLSQLQQLAKQLNYLSIPQNTVFVFYLNPQFFNSNSLTNAQSNLTLQTGQYYYFQIQNDNLQLVQPNLNLKQASFTLSNSPALGTVNVLGSTLPNLPLVVNYEGATHQLVSNAQGVFQTQFQAYWAPYQTLRFYLGSLSNVPVFQVLQLNQNTLNKSNIAFYATVSQSTGYRYGIVGFNPYTMHLTYNNFASQFVYPSFMQPSTAPWAVDYAQNNWNNYFLGAKNKETYANSFLFSFRLLNAKGISLAKMSVTTSTTYLQFANFINNLTFDYGDQIQIVNMQAFNDTTGSIYNLSNQLAYSCFIMGSNNFNNLVWSPVETTSDAANNAGQSTQEGPIIYDATISTNGFINTASSFINNSGQTVPWKRISLNLTPSNYVNHQGQMTTDSYCPSYVSDLNYSAWPLFNNKGGFIPQSYDPTYDLTITGPKLQSWLKNMLGSYSVQTLLTNAKVEIAVTKKIMYWLYDDQLKPDESTIMRYTCNQMFNSSTKIGAVCEGYAEMYADLLSAAGFVAQIVTGYFNTNAANLPTIYNAGLTNHDWVCVYLPALHRWQMTNPSWGIYDGNDMLNTFYNIVSVATLWSPAHNFMWYFQDNQNTKNNTQLQDVFFLQGNMLNQYYDYVKTASSNLTSIYKYIQNV